MISNFKLIVTDLQTRKAFDIYNICKRLGYNIIGTFNGSSFERFVLSLIYSRKVKKLSYDNFDMDFNLLVHNSSEKFIFFPTEENTILCFYDYIKNHNTNNIYYNLPEKSTFELVQNKGSFSKFCIENKFPVPSEYEYDQLVSSAEIPSNLIIKPKIGSGSMGIRFIDSLEELFACNDLDFDKYIIQERLENSQNIEGAFFLFDKGEFISYYGHKRIRTYPPEGGVTVYSKYEFNEELKILGIALLEKLNWSGVAMVEFLFDEKTNSYKIIEVNPRVWGSIMLSEFSGAGMIENYIRISIGSDVVDSKIKEETYIRWFFPWDVISYIKNRGNIKDFWSFNREKTCYINFTYAPWYRSISFLIYNVFHVKILFKLFKKMSKK